MSAAIARALAARLPPGLGLGWCDPTTPGPLWPGEAVPRAIPRRQAEFAAGRSAARMAMAAIGAAPQSIPAGPDRAPVWPEGLTGSITHSATACLALVGHLADWQGIGIDIEPATPLGPDLWPTVLTPTEQVSATGMEAKLRFAIKESAYKAQYRQSQTLFGFETLEITFHAATFAARFTRPVPPFPQDHVLHGMHLIADDHLVAVTLIR